MGSHGFTCDVSSSSAVEGAVARVAAELGPVGVLVNNAGVTRDATMRRMTEEDLRTVLEVHLVGAWLCT